MSSSTPTTYSRRSASGSMAPSVFLRSSCHRALGQLDGLLVCWAVKPGPGPAAVPSAAGRREARSDEPEPAPIRIASDSDTVHSWTPPDTPDRRASLRADGSRPSGGTCAWPTCDRSDVAHGSRTSRLASRTLAIRCRHSSRWARLVSSMARLLRLQHLADPAGDLLQVQPGQGPGVGGHRAVRRLGGRRRSRTSRRRLAACCPGPCCSAGAGTRAGGCGGWSRARPWRPCRRVGSAR